MRKVLIISYFFPPGNFAGSFRIKAWVDHLSKFGYYPVVITRHWDENETDFSSIPENKTIQKEETKNYTIYRLPYKGTLRDRLIRKFGKRLVFPAKIISFTQLFFQNFFIRSIAFSNFYFFAQEVLKKDEEIKFVITSGRPFIQFKICWKLKRDFPQIHWIADYRDPWNSGFLMGNGFKNKVLQIIEKPFEKRWLKNATFYTTTSLGFKENISQILRDHQGYVVTNGFESFKNCPQNFTHEFVIGYLGSLYPQQKIEIFLNGFTNLLKKYPGLKIKLLFWGIGNYHQEKRIKNSLKGFENYFEIIPKIKKEELEWSLCTASCFLLCGIPERKGTYTAKLFDYFSFQKPIILSPSDKDILHETILRTKTGVVLQSQEEVSSWLHKTYENRKLIPYEGNKKTIELFKLENQVKILAKKLSEINDLK